MNDEGGKILAYLMSQITKLKVLTLKHNSIMGKGALKLADEIRQSDRL